VAGWSVEQWQGKKTGKLWGDVTTQAVVSKTRLQHSLFNDSFALHWEANFIFPCPSGRKTLETGLAAKRARHLYLIFFWLTLLWTCVLTSCWRQLRTKLVGAVLSV